MVSPLKFCHIIIIILPLSSAFVYYDVMYLPNQALNSFLRFCLPDFNILKDLYLYFTRNEYTLDWRFQISIQLISMFRILTLRLSNSNETHNTIQDTCNPDTYKTGTLTDNKIEKRWIIFIHIATWSLKFNWFPHIAFDIAQNVAVVSLLELVRGIPGGQMFD